MSMNVSSVDSLLAQMRAAVAAAQGQPGGSVQGAGAVSFQEALKTSLDGVNQVQRQAEAMQQAFVLGDDRVTLSDTMIAMQKADIAFKTAVQVRNKFVQAYSEIMNMQV